jgi:hypothetical protein
VLATYGCSPSERPHSVMSLLRSVLPSSRPRRFGETLSIAVASRCQLYRDSGYYTLGCQKTSDSCPSQPAQEGMSHLMQQCTHTLGGKRQRSTPWNPRGVHKNLERHYARLLVCFSYFASSPESEQRLVIPLCRNSSIALHVCSGYRQILQSSTAMSQPTTWMS